jgi:hypothetical protein
VAEGGGLLNRYTLSRRIEGSNPSVSANAIDFIEVFAIYGFHPYMNPSFVIGLESLAKRPNPAKSTHRREPGTSSLHSRRAEHRIKSGRYSRNFR